MFLSDQALHITTGFLVLNLWSFAGDEDRADVNFMTLQPFLNYNLPKGWYLTTSPLITADWEADDDNRWTVSLGGGIGRIFKIGHQPINANIAAYYNVVTPDDTGAIGSYARRGRSFSQHIIKAAERGCSSWRSPDVPVRHRMRAYDRDPIRGAHYGQRSW